MSINIPRRFHSPIKGRAMMWLSDQDESVQRETLGLPQKVPASFIDQAQAIRDGVPMSAPESGTDISPYQGAAAVGRGVAQAARSFMPAQGGGGFSPLDYMTLPPSYHSNRFPAPQNRATVPGSPNVAKGGNMNATAMTQFLEWLRDYNPALFVRARKAAEQGKGLSGLGMTEQEIYAADVNLNGGGTSGDQTWWQNLLNSLPTLANTYLQTDMQRKILDIQKERAKQGLSPLDTSALAAQLQANVSVDPATIDRAVQRAAAETGAGIKRWLLPIGIGAGVLVYIATRK